MSARYLLGAATAAMFALFAHPGLARECRDRPVPGNIQTALFSHVARNGTSEDTYTVAAMGNEHTALGTDLKPLPAEQLATVIKGDPKFATVTRIVLEWPYSARGDAPYARELEALLEKPVDGYAGPVWWYADGTLIAARGSNGMETGPDAADVTECAISDGALLEGAACQPVFVAHKTQTKYFGNAPYDLTCDEVNQMEILSDQGDRKATQRLLLYHQFVNRDAKAEQKYSSRPR
ncbi:hypothetical protein [Emcibacter sp. SYSU 3D8]|uniref:hypothetical protein n=1 Tax=Emcibacter sp. SYSU 3D8 TaxID=3133969 RepID=UPI0031FF2DD0